MNRSTEFAKLDFQLNKFQQEIHQPSSVNEEITTDLLHDCQKRTFNTPVRLAIKGVINEKLITFSTEQNPVPTHLFFSEFWQTIPAIRVKAEYQDSIGISWTHNLLNNIIVWGELRFDNEPIQHIDSVWLDIYSENFIPSGYRENHQANIGNIPNLEEPTTFLPRYTLKTKIPWFTSRDSSQSVPIYLFPDRVVHQSFEIQRNIIELLRFYKKKVDPKTGRVTWAKIKANPELVEGLGPEGKFDIPQLWGSFKMISDFEKATWAENMKIINYNTEDIISCSAIEPKTYGEKCAVDLESKHPVKAMFIVAENLEGREYHNYSNYTTNSMNVYAGYDPIGTIGLKYGPNFRIPEETDARAYDEQEDKFPITPIIKGFHRKCFGDDVVTLDVTSGVTMEQNRKLVVKLENGDIYRHPVIVNDEKKIKVDELDTSESKKIEEDKQVKGPKFLVHVRLLVTRRLTFTYNPVKRNFDISMDRIIKSQPSQ